MTNKKIKSPLGSIPNPFSSHEGLFHDVSEAKYAIRGVLRDYFSGAAGGEDDYLFFKTTAVRFEKNPMFDLDFDHYRRTIFIILKEPQGEGAEDLKTKIRHQLQLECAAMAADVRGRVAMSIYRALDPQTQNQLIENERQREKKNDESSGR